MALSPDLVSASSNLLCAEDAGDVASWDDGCATAADDHTDEWAPACHATAAALVDGSGLASLLAAETDHMPRPDYLPRFLSRPLDATARHDAVKWILKARTSPSSSPCHFCESMHKCASFPCIGERVLWVPSADGVPFRQLPRPLPLHSFPSGELRFGLGDLASMNNPVFVMLIYTVYVLVWFGLVWFGLKGVENGGSGGGWPMQLLSVACVSVAAKMEEAHVPGLLDLQILDPRYVFDPRTVCRMELLLMSALCWRMRTVTPFDFLPHLAPSSPSILLSRAADLILSTLRGMHSSPTPTPKNNFLGGSALKCVH